MTAAVSAAVDVATVGEALIALTPSRRGALRDVDLLHKGVGGAELNVAVAVSRLGHRSRWSGLVGDDELAHEIVGLLRRETVDVDTVVHRPGARIGVYVKEQTAADLLRVLYYRDDAAGTLLRPDDLDLELVVSSRIVHLTGITAALRPFGSDLVAAIMAKARTAGAYVTFDVNMRANLVGDRDVRDLLLPHVRAADLVFCSDDEADQLFDGHDEGHLAAAVQALRLTALVVHGSWGAIALDDDGTTRQETEPVTVVDAVGAGDAFVAGYLSGVVRGWSTRERLELANAAGRCAVSVRGDAESMPYEGDVLTLLRRREHVER